ncbi:MAG: secretin N-terminal domain-containing protein [bacterium]
MKSRNLIFLLLCVFIFLRVELYAATKKISVENIDDLKIYKLEKEYRKLDTKYFTLKKAKALELKPIIENMLSIYGSVYVNEKDNTLYVTDTLEMVKALEKIVQQLDITDIVAGGNLTSRLILLKHTRASDIIDFVKHKLSKDGKIFVVGDLNGLLITDIQSKIEETENLIKDVDVPVKHLSIKVAILELNSDYYKNVGVDITSVLEQISPRISYSRTKSKNKQDYPGTNNDYEYTRDDSNFTISGSASFNLSDFIQIMTGDGKGKVLATPRLVTKNNTTASLNASEMIPYTSAGSSSEGTRRAGISLRVTPIIQQDNFINLKISPNISNLTGWSPKGMPIIFERTLNTEVNVKDGDTFVLGGLKKTEKVKYVRGVPILKSIPLIKYLFSKTVEVELTREVVMFITPTILKESDNMPVEDKNLLEELREKLYKK